MANLLAKSRIVFLNPMLATGKRLSYYSVQPVRIAKLIESWFDSIIATGSYQMDLGSLVLSEGIPIVSMPSTRIPLLSHLFYSLGERYHHFDDIIRTLRPDCLVCTEDLSYSSLQAVNYKLKSGLPVIVYTGLYTYNGFPLGLPHVCFANSYGRRVYKHASAYVAKTSAAARLLARFGSPMNKVRIIPPTIDMTRFKPVKAPSWLSQFGNSDRLNILFVGLLRRNKNPVGLLEAFESVRRSYNLRLIMLIRDGPERNRVSKSIRELNLESDVLVLRNVPPKDLPGLYSIADLLVSPSYIEIFGMNILEALSCGTPVVCTPTAGSSDIVEHKHNGILTSGFSIDALTEAIDTLLSDDLLFKEITANARQSLYGRFDSKTVASKWRAVLSHAICDEEV